MECQLSRCTTAGMYILQGVEASTLAVADTRAAPSKAAAGPATAQDVLQAAFKRERRLHSEEEDPHM